ncbi:hypothetical protein KEM54_004701 [Ascosphaera aggregata]|nr:hypothetical protein KEM54_004701 [Ascosphaera aggregata]
MRSVDAAMIVAPRVEDRRTKRQKFLVRMPVIEAFHDGTPLTNPAKVLEKPGSSKVPIKRFQACLLLARG